MRVIVRVQATLDGLTYSPGEYDLADGLARKLLHNFRAKVEPVSEPAEEALPEEEYVCGFLKADGTPCQIRVSAPGERCHHHREK